MGSQLPGIGFLRSSFRCRQREFLVNRNLPVMYGGSSLLALLHGLTVEQQQTDFQISCYGINSTGILS
ncbi:hypothetical protein DPMN_053900 [Dreissena polymorpha]|uniref:Uncharacterized protein n=1 Tax=Dreissena polymorpha TaxID=45954 RepID=A0A9D4CM95_DREPO|nr:hypothetical protein DPMN_053900 [Dreissena polymorpha]